MDIKYTKNPDPQSSEGTAAVVVKCFAIARARTMPCNYSNSYLNHLQTQQACVDCYHAYLPVTFLRRIFAN